MSQLAPFDSAWFKRRTREVGVKQDDIAQELGCTRSNVSRLLSGQYALRLTDVPTLARVLRAPMAEILRRAGLPLDSSILSQPEEQSDVR